VGHISAGGVEKDVRFVEAGAAVSDVVDDAYRSKYRRYAQSYVLPMWFAFGAASLALATAFAASASPIPLYELYRGADGLTKTDLSLTAVAYCGAAIPGIAGQLARALSLFQIVTGFGALAAIACVVALAAARNPLPDIDVDRREA
jgi:hypothetical protein